MLKNYEKSFTEAHVHKKFFIPNMRTVSSFARRQTNKNLEQKIIFLLLLLLFDLLL
jgi:hypothetical protein